MNGLKFAAALALLLTSTVGWAAPRVIGCHGCSESTARRMAEAQIPSNSAPGVYDVYVANTPARTLWRYRVFVEQESGFSTYVRATTPASDWLSQFRRLADAWKVSASGGEVVLEPGHPVGSVTETFRNAAAVEAVSLSINRSFTAIINAIMGVTIQGLTKATLDFKHFQLVVFPDGTSAQFQLADVIPGDGDLHILRYSYKPGSARDSEGNAIPDRRSAFANFAADYANAYNEGLFLRQARLHLIELMTADQYQRISVVCVQGPGEVPHCWVRKH